MINLVKKINDKIETEIYKKGICFPGSESVTVQLILTDEEKSKFYDLDLGNNCYYEIEGNTVSITYIEPDIVFNELKKLEGETMIFNNFINELQHITSYDILDYISESEILYNSSVSFICNDIEYNIMFEIIKINNCDSLKSKIKILEVEYI